MLRCVCRVFCINSYCNYNKMAFSHYQILSDQCLKQVFCRGQFYSYSQANTQVERYWALPGTSNIRNSRSLPRAIAVPDMKTAVWIYENPIWNTALNVIGYHRWFSAIIDGFTLVHLKLVSILTLSWYFWDHLAVWKKNVYHLHIIS